MASSTSVRDAFGWTVVTVTGELDISAAPRLREQLVDLIRDGHRRLVVDMEAVTFIDSTGLGVLIGALKRLRGADGELRVIATRDPVVRMMYVTGLHRVFTPHASLEDLISRPAVDRLQTSARA